MERSRKRDRQRNDTSQEACEEKSFKAEEQEKIFIIGGGTSLQEILDDPVLYADLHEFPLMGCNKAVEHFDCDYLVFFDHGNFMHGGKYETTCDTFKGKGGIYAPRPLDAAKERKDTHYIKKINGLQCDKQGIYCGNNSGVTALSVAVALGYKRIYLLGMDARFSDTEKTHFHDGYTVKNNTDRMFESFATHFNMLGGYIQTTRPDVRVFNCSKISTVDPERKYFKRMHISRALYGNG